MDTYTRCTRAARPHHLCCCAAPPLLGNVCGVWPQVNAVDERLHDVGVDVLAVSALHNITAYDSNFGFPGERGLQHGFKSPPASYSTAGYA